MFYFLVLFSSLLIIANIYCFFSKKYLYLFIPCALFLPEYYGIDISNSLPVLTVTRIMYMIFFIYAIVNRKKNLSIKRIDFKKIPLEYKFIGAYFLLRIIANFYYLFTYGKSIKTLFLLLFEQLFLLLAFYILSPSMQELNVLAKVIVWSATVMFVIGIIESYTFIRPFDALQTVSRNMLNDHYFRLGLLRSTTTMGLPGFYGNMCLIIMPLILYLFRLTNHFCYLIIALLDIFAIIQSGSRSDIYFIACISGLFLIFLIIKKQEWFSYIKHVFIILTTIVLLIVVLSKLSPRLMYYYEGFFISNLRVIGIEVEPEAEITKQYKSTEGNVNAVASRTYQFSGIKYALSKNPLFGLGNGALQSGDVYYYAHGHWIQSYTFDVGIVEILVSEGIIGLLAHSLLFLALFTIYIKRGHIHITTKDACILMLWPAAYLLSTLSTANMYSFLFVIMFYFLTYKAEDFSSNGKENY